MESHEPMEEDTPLPPEPPEYPLGSCTHLVHYKTEDVVLCFELLHSYYVACLFKDSWEKKAKNCKCSTCEAKKSGNEINQFVFACLQCENFSCYEHIGDHALIKLHPLAMDMDYGRIFCAGCKDFRYDAELEKISQNQKKIAARRRGSVTGLTYEGILQREPNLVELELLKYHKVVYRSSQTDARGFRNIDGVSCYLIVIIQSFIHAPVFRDYLLSFKHKCKYKDDGIPVCFICEMVNIAQECFSGKSESYIFSRLFYLYWYRCKRQCKIDMADADLGYVELLEQFHLDLEGSSPASGSCGCIVHNIFGIKFEKHLICNSCSNVSTICEPPSFLIHLLLQPSDYNSGQLTFFNCLRSALEGEIPDYKCNKCLKKGYISRTILLHLPIVLTFCLNDPEQLLHRIERLYGEFLDMSPYIQMSDIENKQDKLSSNLKYQYYLFAVIEFFRGSIEKRRTTRQKKTPVPTKVSNQQVGDAVAGHYFVYIRQHGERWIKCNDEKITQVKPEDVLKVKNARMLFYHRMYP